MNKLPFPIFKHCDLAENFVVFGWVGTRWTMSVHGVSGEAKVTCTMNQYSLKNPRPSIVNELRKRSWYSTSVSRSVVAVATPSKILACIQILKPPLVFPFDGYKHSGSSHELSQFFTRFFPWLTIGCLLACWLLCHACEFVLVILKFCLCVQFFSPCEH